MIRITHSERTEATVEERAIFKVALALAAPGSNLIRAYQSGGQWNLVIARWHTTRRHFRVSDCIEFPSQYTPKSDDQTIQFIRQAIAESRERDV